MILDIISAGECLAAAIACFVMHRTSATRGIWLHLPWYVRWSRLFAGVALTWRAVSFATIAGHPRGIGHANIPGAVTWGAMALTFTAGAIYVFATDDPTKGDCR